MAQALAIRDAHDLASWGDRKLDNAIQRGHAAAGAHMRGYEETATMTGLLLIERKRRLAHGAWLPWLGEHFEGGKSTAYRYIDMAENWLAKFPSTGTLDAPDEPIEPPAPTPDEPVDDESADDDEIVDGEVVEDVEASANGAAPASSAEPKRRVVRPGDYERALAGLDAALAYVQTVHGCAFPVALIERAHRLSQIIQGAIDQKGD